MLLAMLSLSQLKAQQIKHVILITIDGFRPDFYLDSTWKATNIRELMKAGTYTLGMNSVFPSMTYPSHTTIITGVQPAKHGVYFNAIFEPTGSTGKQYWNSSSIKVPTLWSLAKEKGLKVSSILWPVSADAPVDYNIPDIGGLGEAIRAQYSKPAGFTDTVRNLLFAGRGLDLARDVQTAQIAAHVIETNQPNLMTVHLLGVDHFEHEEGRDGPQVRQAVAGADSGIAIIAKALRTAGIWENTVVIVTGDHGFVNVKQVISPNLWLIKAGLMNNIASNDWKAQFFSVSGSTYLYLRDPKDKKTVSRVRKLLSGLPQEEKKLFRIIDRKKLVSIGGNPEAALALAGEDGTSFDNRLTGTVIRPGKGGAHGYFPDFQEIRTGFVATGPGITKGGIISLMNVRDIAPSVAKMLGLDLKMHDGRIPTELFEK
jgi:predicted AlkP superfamily pyrophosphatase or phosphodiesterase